MKKHVAADIAAQMYPTFDFRATDTVAEILSRYPAGQTRSAVMPLLDLAQRQVAEDGATQTPPFCGWIPKAAMDKIGEIIGESPIKVYEVDLLFHVQYGASR